MHRHKIMIYSRDRDTLDEITSCLDKPSHIVQTALSVAEARALLESELLHTVIIGEEEKADILCRLIRMVTGSPWNPVCIVYLTGADRDTVIKTVNSGCSYFISSSSELEEIDSIMEQLRDNVARVYPLPEEDTGDIIRRVITMATRIHCSGKLSRRQREILYHLLMGKTNAQISAQLDISEKTVKNHLWKVYKKFNIDNRTQLFHKLLTSSPGYSLREKQGKLHPQQILGSKSP